MSKASFAVWLEGQTWRKNAVGEVARFFRDTMVYAIHDSNSIGRLSSELFERQVELSMRRKVKLVHRVWRKWTRLGGNVEDYIIEMESKGGAKVA